MSIHQAGEGVPVPAGTAYRLSDTTVRWPEAALHHALFLSEQGAGENSKSRGPRMRKNSKADTKTQKLRLLQRRELRRSLPHLLADVAALLPKAEAIALTHAASLVPELFRAIASALEGETGLESDYRVAVLGTISDLALMHARAAQKSPLATMPLGSPAEILLWFAAYLEDTLEKRDLRLQDDEGKR